MQAAQVGIAKSAYFPTAVLSGVKNTGNFGSTVTNYSELDYQIRSNSHDVAINLSWTLFDFGARQANLERANQLLIAANATQDATLQKVFANTTQAFYDAQSANGALHASRDSEQVAKESFDAAEAKFNAGVGTLADRLQAQTNFVQARLNRVNVDAAKADGLPVFSLVGNLDKNKQPGQYSIDTTTDTSIIGIQVKIPLFDGVAHSYRVQSANAKLESKQADLKSMEQQIALDVWKNYQALATETENLTNSKELVESATQSFNVARGRYKSGIGNIIELLNAETALSKAKQQYHLFLSNWYAARINLAASLGQLGMWAVK